MIEKYLIENDLTLKRYRRFKKESWPYFPFGVFLLQLF